MESRGNTTGPGMRNAMGIDMHGGALALVLIFIPKIIFIDAKKNHSSSRICFARDIFPADFLTDLPVCFLFLNRGLSAYYQCRFPRLRETFLNVTFKRIYKPESSSITCTIRVLLVQKLNVPQCNEGVLVTFLP